MHSNISFPKLSVALRQYFSNGRVKEEDVILRYLVWPRSKKRKGIDIREYNVEDKIIIT